MLPNTEELVLPVLLPVAQISPSSVNETREGKDKNIEGLAADIASNGLLQPITVRPIADGYELIFGERRWNAFKFLNREKIPAFVKNVNDKEAHLMTFSENFQRENLSPLEEAIALQVLLSDGMTPEEIAIQVGRDIKWVSRRLKLSNLSEKIKELYLTGKLYAWGPAHLETIARFEIHTQDSFFKENGIYANDEIDYVELNHLSIEDLKDGFDHFLMQLSSVPWDLNDSDLHSTAGACSSCPKRTSIQTNLFESMTEKGKTIDRCIDPDCYQIKQKNFAKQKLEKLQQKNPEIVKITTNWSVTQKKDEERDDLEKGAVYSYSAYECKKNEPGAKQALFVDGPNAGTTKWVKLPETSRDKVKREKTDVDVKIKYDTKKKVAVINAMIAFLSNELKCPAKSEALVLTEILPVIIIFGCDNIESLPNDIFNTDDFSIGDQWKNVQHINKTFKEDDMITRLLTLVFPRWMRSLKQSLDKNSGSSPDSGLAMAENIAKLFMLNWEEFCSQAHSTVKIPKKVAEQLDKKESEPKPEENKGKKPAKKTPAKKKAAKPKKKKESEPDPNDFSDDEFYTNDPENLVPEE